MSTTHTLLAATLPTIAIDTLAQPVVLELASGQAAPVSTPPRRTIDGSTCSDQSFTEANLEYCKYLLEREKFDQQRLSGWVTRGARFLSALVAVGTIAFNIRNANAQARLQAKLKALEAVVSAAGPNSAKQRLAIVDGILGSALVPEAKQPSFEIEGIGAGHDASRRELLKSLAEHPDRRAEIIRDWETVFGKAKLGDDIRRLRDDPAEWRAELASQTEGP